MASLLVRRAPSTIGEAFSLFKSSARHLRGFSTAASTESSSTAGDGGVKKPKRKKKKNVFEVAGFRPNWRIGYHMAKTHWNNVSYEITKLNLYKMEGTGRLGEFAHKDASRSPMHRGRSAVFTNADGDIFRIRKSQHQGKILELLDEMDLLRFTSLQLPLN